MASIATRAKRRPNGLSDLSHDERIYNAVALLDEARVNHGLEYFFTTYGDQLLGDAISGLTRLKANQTLAVLLCAAHILHPADCLSGVGRDEDGTSAAEAVVLRGQSVRGLLSELDDALVDDPDHIGERLEDFAYRQNLVGVTA